MKNSVKELTEGMQRLCATANRIVAHPEAVSRIEQDLLLEDLRRLYDTALRLETVAEPGEVKDGEDMKVVSPASLSNDPDAEILTSTVMATMAAMSVPEPALEPESAPEPAPEPEPETPDIPEPPEILDSPEAPSEPAPEPVELPKMEELESNGNSLLFDEVIIEPESHVTPETPEAPETPEIPDNPDDPEIPVEPVPEPAPEPTPEPEPAPKHAGTQASLLDYLSHPVEEKPSVRTLGESLGNKVADLRTVININDKFSFMSDLFHNNMKAYNDFILRLNAIDNRDEALLCVNEVSAQYKWDENSAAVQSFYKVFDKKF